MPRQRKERESRQQTARMMKQGMILAIATLVVILFALLLQLGREAWPFWLILHRKQMVGVMVLAIVLLSLSSPILIEASSAPRALSGPGKNPEGPRLNDD